MTEEMLAAGVDALKANFPNFTYESAARECYLAMKAAEPLPQGDEGRGVCGFLSQIMTKTPNGEWIAVQYHQNGDWSVGSAALARSPIGDDVRDVLIEAQALSRRLAQLIILTDDEKAVFAKIDAALNSDIPQSIGNQSIEGERG